MRSVFFALAVFAVGLGCSSSDGGTPAAATDSGTDTPAVVTADQACTELSGALCDQIQTCAPLFVDAAYGDLANCKTRAKLDCMNAANAPSTGALPADISTCATAAKAATCADLLNNNWPAACAPKPGGIADGAPCGNDSQCKSGFCGLDEDKEVCGVCAAKPTEGKPCVRGRCPQGLVCSADRSTCGKPVAVGGACGATSACIAGSQCFGGKCVANVTTEGAACDEKAGPNCEGSKGLTCLSDKCMKLTLVEAGKPCGLLNDGTKVTGLALCEKNGWCKGLDPAASKFTGVCEAAAADGAACVADATYMKGPGCVEPAECVGGKCTLPDAATCK